MNQVLFFLILLLKLKLQLHFLLNDKLQLGLFLRQLLAHEFEFFICRSERYSLWCNLLIHDIELTNRLYPLADTLSSLRCFFYLLRLKFRVGQIGLDLLDDSRINIFFRIIFQLFNELFVVRNHLLRYFPEVNSLLVVCILNYLAFKAEHNTACF